MAGGEVCADAAVSWSPSLEATAAGDGHRGWMCNGWEGCGFGMGMVGRGMVGRGVVGRGVVGEWVWLGKEWVEHMYLGEGCGQGRGVVRKEEDGSGGNVCETQKYTHTNPSPAHH